MAKKFITLAARLVLSAIVVLMATVFTGCSKDSNGADEPDNPGDPGVTDESVIINPDGSATGGAIYYRVDDVTFYLNHVKYKIEDSHLIIIDCDRAELPETPQLFAEVTINGTLFKTRYINGGAFKRSSITAIRIPSTVLELGGSCFYECRSLSKVIIPEGVTYLHQDCFAKCTSLTEITIPQSVTYILSGCFDDCDNLTKITFNGCPDIYVYSYDIWAMPFVGGVPVATAYVPNSVLSTFKAKYWRSFTEIIGY